MEITIYDTGFVNDDFDVSEGRLPSYTNATHAQRLNGEYQITTPLVLKLTDFDTSLGTAGFNVPNRNMIKNKSVNTSFEVIDFKLRAHIIKQQHSSEDLNKLSQIILYKFSRGHKDLVISNNLTVGDNRGLVSIYWYLDVMGKTDTGNPLSERHLNINIKQINIKDSVSKNLIDLTLNCEILPNLQ